MTKIDFSRDHLGHLEVVSRYRDPQLQLRDKHVSCILHVST